MKTAGIILALFLSVLAASAQAQFLAPSQRLAETPEGFARRLVRLYAPHGRWWSDKSPASDAAYRAKVYAEFYDPEFEKLIDDNGALASKRMDGPDLDSDPVCQCQDDPGGLKIKSVSRRTAMAADVTLFMPCDKGADQCGLYTIVLKRIAGTWKIHDVIDSQGSIRAMLIRHNSCLRARLSDAALDRCLR